MDHQVELVVIGEQVGIQVKMHVSVLVRACEFEAFLQKRQRRLPGDVAGARHQGLQQSGQAQLQRFKQVKSTARRVGSEASIVVDGKHNQDPQSR